MFCRCLLGFVLILRLFPVDISCRYFLLKLCSYIVRILSIFSRVFTGNTSSLCASGLVHPQVVPLTVSSHLLNVPFIVKLNIIICNRSCTVIHSTILFHNSTSRNLCLFFVDVLSMFVRFCVDSLFIRCWFFVLFFLSIFRPHFVRIIARNQSKKHKPALRLRTHPTTSGPTYCIVPLIERPIYCKTEYNNL